MFLKVLYQQNPEKGQKGINTSTIGLDKQLFERKIVIHFLSISLNNSFWMAKRTVSLRQLF